jgi:serine/threonine-protein kinase
VPGEDAGIPFGPYVLLRRIARGGMAEVFLARQRGFHGFDRRVAIKRILPQLADAPDFIKMFLAEAKLAAQLTHPNIVHIYEFGKVESDYFIAMEYVEGVHAGQLFDRSSRADRLSPTMVARLGADAATALHHAHELRAPGGKLYGLVHRDVSPANLMVSFDGAVKLCDFGIAKAAELGDQLTNPGHIKGKYAYMSPEQTTGAPLDGRSDVYSLAIVLWELVSGKLIVPRGDAASAMRAIRDGKLTPIERAAPWTPPPLAAAITRALQTHREHRPTAMQLAEELEAFIKSSPELATPMQLGAWLRARFTREPTGGETEAAAVPEPLAPPGALATPRTAASQLAASSDHVIARSPMSTSSIITSQTTSETAQLAQLDHPADAATVLVTDRAAFEPTAPPAALRFDVQAAAAEPTGPPGPGGSSGFDDPAAAEPTDPPGSTSLIDDDETVMRSGAFRALVPSGPPVVPTLLEAPRRQSPGGPPAALPESSPRPSPGAAPAGPTMLEAPPRPSPNGPPVPATLLEAPPRQAPRGAPVATTLLEASPRQAPRGAAVAATLLEVPPRSGPGGTVAPTLLEAPPRPPHPAVRGSPLAGAPTLRGVPPPPARAPTESVRTPSRRALALGGLFTLAVLSFAVALAARGKPRATGALRDAAIASAAPRDAAPDDPPPGDAAAPPLPLDAREPTIPLDAGATTILEIRTRPDGARITIAGETHASPARFALPPGHYAIDAELDGWMPERRALDLAPGDHVVQDIVFTTPLSHGRAAAPGRLSVRTTPPCEVFLGPRRLSETPITDLELAAGSYTLVFKHPQHATVSRGVTITSGKLTRLSFALP